MSKFLFFTLLGIQFINATSPTNDHEANASGGSVLAIPSDEAEEDGDLEDFPPSSHVQAGVHQDGDALTPESDDSTPRLWRPAMGGSSAVAATIGNGAASRRNGDDVPSNVGSTPGSQDGVLSRSRRPNTTDKEALELPDESPYAPTGCILCFKRGVVAGANLASFGFRILSGLSTVVATIGVSNFLSGDSIFGASSVATPAPTRYNQTTNSTDIAAGPSLTTMLTIWGSIGAVCFKSLENSLKAIGQREEIRLLSYEQTLAQFAQEEAGERVFSDEVLKNFLVQQNKFVTLPGRINLTVQCVAYNSLCFIESISEILLAICTSITASTTGAGVTNVNLLYLDSMDTYRKLTLVLGLTTATLTLLEKKRKTLKQSCEDWLVNHRMARLYLIWVRQIEESIIYDHIQALPIAELPNSSQPDEQ